jgi:histidinol phosphatase-like enzyme
MSKRLIVDIDETICTTKGTDYEKAKPKKKMIKKLNKLYDEGIEIVYWTARGGRSGVNWTALTNKQFKEWGVKYTELVYHKPDYVYFICDKCIHPDDFLKLKEVI